MHIIQKHEVGHNDKINYLLSENTKIYIVLYSRFIMDHTERRHLSKVVSVQKCT